MRAGALRQIHLDPMGGVAGDMLLAGLLHAFPECADGVLEVSSRISGCVCSTRPCRDHALSGLRFQAQPPMHPDRHNDADHDHNTQDHPHIVWRDIRKRLEGAGLPLAVEHHAIGIFSILAAAEGEVHAVAPDDVTFHEVGAADSIADIIGAAWLIDHIGPATWSCAPLPLGSGRVQTAHGLLPIPAPATALLLKGFATIDDGIPGERVTPTGAAILNYLQCTPARAGIGTLTRSGFGFGTRHLPGLSNCLRILVFEAEPALSHAAHRKLSVIAFEVDDQSPEDL
ncbi:MAG: LarC family nickel insertion protein, partial [Pseudomonadota bacterium]|nr:LarC family nickel insertion protein [Pseudomonadota bacterium]